ncbi:WD repeat-containing protein 87-like [Helianthus annuus]|uniref:WD repeat-containing protein 87-like n=1 Tax=Helianthus annuus TaxID=4232 RepID=UPI000B8F950A|nr:WD repeat-containing protein 87-like [Helianthus annuus]
MAEEFYNTFFNAFTSESSEITNPPTLESIEDYTWWKERFINWAKAYAHESWFCLEFGYERPKNDKGEELPFKKLPKDDKAEYAAEQRMIALIQTAIRNDIFALLTHDGSSKSVWEALRVKAEWGKQIRKNKIALLKKEFDLFDSLKGETVRQMIERFCHLKIELERFEIVKTREELIDKVAEEVNTEVVEVEFVKEIKNEEVEKAVTEEQQTEEEVKKEEEEKKNESLDAGDAGEEVSVEKKQDDPEMKQTEAAENTEVPITEVLNENKDCEIGGWSSLAQQEEEVAAGPCVG